MDMGIIFSYVFEIPINHA